VLDATVFVDEDEQRATAKTAEVEAKAAAECIVALVD